ncbi:MULTISPECIES: hypothetical protein [Microbaculum]|nr:hypothetical protein [Microbaculum sp. A6E488]
MKAFWGGVVLMLVIAVGAWVVLDAVGMSARDIYTSQQSVRL